VQLENNISAHILPLADRKIFTPEKEQFWPARENLQWHSKRIFSQ